MSLQNIFREPKVRSREDLRGFFFEPNSARNAFCAACFNFLTDELIFHAINHMTKCALYQHLRHDYNYLATMHKLQKINRKSTHKPANLTHSVGSSCIKISPYNFPRSNLEFQVSTFRAFQNFNRPGNKNCYVSIINRTDSIV